MTREQAKAFAPIMAAYGDGKTIQFRDYQGNWTETSTPLWEPTATYRIKPDPKTRPWSKPDDVPGPVCYLRSKGFSEGWSLITGARTDESGSMDGVLLVGFRIGSRFVSWSELSEFEYSTDRKTWHKCEVTEEAQ